MTPTADSGQAQATLLDPSVPPSRSLGQIQAFDGMRGLAVLIVFVAHMNVILPIPHLLVVPGATVSLDSFFVLSGFLITTLLLNEQSRRGKVKVSNFYGRRVLRLLPALYVVVVALAVFTWVTSTWMHTETASIFSVIFYYSNYYSATAPSVFAPRLASGFQHLWSLSFEEQFYLVWPWVTIAVLTIRMRLRTVVIILLSLIVLVGVHRAISFESGVHWWALFQRTDTRADSILWGTLLAHLWVRRREPTRGLRIAAWIAAAFLLACLPLASQDSCLPLPRGLRPHRRGVCRLAAGHSRRPVGRQVGVQPQALHRPGHRVVRLLPLAPAGLLCHPVLRSTLERRGASRGGRHRHAGLHPALVVPPRTTVDALAEAPRGQTDRRAGDTSRFGGAVQRTGTQRDRTLRPRPSFCCDSVRLNDPAGVTARVR